MLPMFPKTYLFLPFPPKVSMPFSIFVEKVIHNVPRSCFTRVAFSPFPFYFHRVRTSEFHFELPPELLAQSPAPCRDQSRLLVVQRATGELSHRRFPELLDYLRPGDVLVLNNSKVIPARLRGVNACTGGEFELLLLEENAVNDWWAMMRPGKRARIDTKINITDRAGAPANIVATVIDTNEEGHRRLQFSGSANLLDDLPRLGEIPLPHYIKREKGSESGNDSLRYQTVYAQPRGSVAAPTAGLHFTEELLECIRSLGVRVCEVTLHVGAGTFTPVKADRIEEHVMHAERYDIPLATAATINEAKSRGDRVIAVGTTSLRVLETVYLAHQKIVSGPGRTRI